MSDLATLLDEAAPTPRTELDVDAVLRRGDSLRRRRTVAATLATVVALLAMTGVVAELADTPDLPMVGERPGEAAPGPRPGTYADGAVVIGAPGQSPTLDMATEQGLEGVLLTTLDGRPDEVAVAADGTVGVLDGSMVRVFVKGEVAVERPVIGTLREFADGDQWPRNAEELNARDLSLAFSTDGTLWLNVPGPDGALIGYDLVGGGVLVAPTPDGTFQRLRILGDTVSVVTDDGFTDGVTQETTVTSVFGSDPLEGPRSIDLRPLDGMDDRGTSFNNDAVVTTSVQGVGRVELRNTPPIPQGEPGGVTFGIWSTAMVADTRAAMVSRTGFERGVVILHRADGTTAGVLVDGVQASIGDEGQWLLSVSPDGAVHLASATPGGGTEVRTLLGPDLLPATAAQTPSEAPTITDGPGDESSHNDSAANHPGFDVRLRGRVDDDRPASQSVRAARRDEVPERLGSIPAQRRAVGGPELSSVDGLSWVMGPASAVLEPLAPDCTGPALCAGQYLEWLLVDGAGDIVLAHALPGQSSGGTDSTTPEGELVGVRTTSSLTGDTVAYRLGPTPGDRTVIVFPGEDSFYLPHSDPTPLRGVLTPDDLPSGWVVADRSTVMPDWITDGGISATTIDALAREISG